MSEHLARRQPFCTLTGAVLALVFVSGCGRAAEEQEPTEAEQTVRKFVSAWSSYDPQLALELFTEDAVYEDTAFGVLLEGREQIVGFFTQSWNAVPDLKMEVVSMFSSGNLVATEWALAGSHTGDYPGLPATNKSFAIRGVGITEVQNGKVRRHTDYYDEAEFRRQLGLLGDEAEEDDAGRDSDRGGG